MRLSSYLVRRGGQLYFRMRVPADVQPLIARQELKRSLETGDARVARRRAARLAARAFRLIAALRGETVLSDDDINRMARAFYAGELERDAALRQFPEDVPELGARLEYEYDHRDEIAQDLVRRSALGRPSDAVRAEAQHDLAQALGYQWLSEVPQSDPLELQELLRRLYQAYMRAAVEANARAKERDQGDWNGSPSEPWLQPRAEPDPAPAAPATPASPAEPVARSGFTPTQQSELTPQAYVELVITEKQLRPSARTKYRAAMRAFEEIQGARAMHDYTEHDVVAFKDALLRAPTYASNLSQCSTLKEAIDWNEAQPAGTSRKALSPTTINDGYLTFLRQVFEHAKRNRHVPVALCQDVQVARTPAQRRGDDKEDAREAFSTVKLNTIFRQPLFLGTRSAKRLFDPGDHLEWSWKFWLPLAMLYMGVRPQELGQLEVTDVVLRVGHPCLLIRTASDSDDVLETDGPMHADSQRIVKSRAGVRELPVHPVLLDLGFMERVRENDPRHKSATRKTRTPSHGARVFPEWPASKGRYAAAASKFFNRDDVDPASGRKMQGLLLRAGVKTQRNALYSLRHNYKGALQNCGFTDGEQDLLMGHAGNHVSRIYRNREVYRGLIDKVCKLEHEGLDLGPLFAARGSRPGGYLESGLDPDAPPLNTGGTVVPFHQRPKTG